MSSRGLKPSHITVIRFGDNREVDIKKGEWVADHYDNNRDFFFTFIDFSCTT